MRTLPPWNDAMSDGCSVPEWLRTVLPIEKPEEIAVCRVHDHAYYLGGSEKDREVADAQFYMGLLQVGMNQYKASMYHAAVRLFGGPEFELKGRSWSYGGDVFAYTEAPAREGI